MVDPIASQKSAATGAEGHGGHGGHAAPKRPWEDASDGRWTGATGPEDLRPLDVSCLDEFSTGPFIYVFDKFEMRKNPVLLKNLIKSSIIYSHDSWLISWCDGHVTRRNLMGLKPGNHG